MPNLRVPHLYPHPAVFAVELPFAEPIPPPSPHAQVLLLVAGLGTAAMMLVTQHRAAVQRRRFLAMTQSCARAEADPTRSPNMSLRTSYPILHATTPWVLLVRVEQSRKWS